MFLKLFVGFLLLGSSLRAMMYEDHYDYLDAKTKLLEKKEKWNNRGDSEKKTAKLIAINEDLEDLFEGERAARGICTGGCISLCCLCCTMAPAYWWIPAAFNGGVGCGLSALGAGIFGPMAFGGLVGLLTWKCCDPSKEHSD